MSEYIFTISETGVQVPVIIETKRGIRNITLRPKTSPTFEIHISKPWLASTTEALQFLESKRKWIERIFKQTPPKKTVRDGDTITILGKQFCLVHNANMHGNCLDGRNLIIGGDKTMFERRVRDFIKAELLSEIKKIIRATPRMYWPRHITLRDTSTRWGSCSSTGTMSFSWRLAFAPYDVMRYVVMHELAHTQHMNHSPDFWHEVSKLYGFGVERARRWLNTHGPELHQYF